MTRTDISRTVADLLTIVLLLVETGIRVFPSWPDVTEVKLYKLVSCSVWFLVMVVAGLIRISESAVLAYNIYFGSLMQPKYHILKVMLPWLLCMLFVAVHVALIVADVFKIENLGPARHYFSFPCSLGHGYVSLFYSNFVFLNFFFITGSIVALVAILYKRPHSSFKVVILIINLVGVILISYCSIVESDGAGLSLFLIGSFLWTSTPMIQFVTRRFLINAENEDSEDCVKRSR